MEIVHVGPDSNLKYRRRKRLITYDLIQELYEHSLNFEAISVGHTVAHSTARELAWFERILLRTEPEEVIQRSMQTILLGCGWHENIFYRFYSLPGVPEDTMLCSQQIHVYASIIDRTEVARKESNPMFQLLMDESNYDSNGDLSLDLNGKGVSDSCREKAKRKAYKLRRDLRSSHEGLVIEAAAFDEMLSRDKYWSRFCEAIMQSGCIYVV